MNSTDLIAVTLTYAQADNLRRLAQWALVHDSEPCRLIDILGDGRSIRSLGRGAGELVDAIERARAACAWTALNAPGRL